MTRRKVFQREITQTDSFQVTATDLQAVENVGLYRLILGEQLLQLHWPMPSQRRHGESRLRGLFHQGWLDRQPFQDGPARPRAVYSLGKQGRLRVAEKLGVPASQVGPRPAKERAHDALFLKHHLATVQVVINLRHAAEQLGGGVVHYQDERALKASRLRDCVSMPVIPDAFVVLSVNGGVQSFCIETDRATVDLRAWKRRFRAYWQFAKTQMFRKDFAKPVVLIVVASDVSLAKRRVTILKQTLDSEALETGCDPSLFWVTTLEQAVPHAVLSDVIWAVGGQDGHFGLLGGGH